MRWLAALICAVSFTAQAQIPALIMPSPLGIIITIGQWIYQGTERVYYIEVAGQGADAEEARKNGFRLAVEQAIGSLISSESEVQNGRLVRDEIISYAAGYVSNFEIVSTENVNRGSRVVMRVRVKRSALANRLLNESKQSGQVDGATAVVSFKTIVNERQTGDQLLQSVLNDFPRRAFDIEIGKTQVILAGQRTAQLQIPIKVKLNSNYLDSLWAALDATQNSGGRTAEITVNLGMFSGGTATYTDDIKYRLVNAAMVWSKPVVRINLMSAQNQVVASALYNMPALSHDGAYAGTPVFVDVGKKTPKWGKLGIAPYQIVIGGGVLVPATVVFDIDSALLAQVTQVHVEIVRQ